MIGHEVARLDGTPFGRWTLHCSCGSEFYNHPTLVAAVEVYGEHCYDAGEADTEAELIGLAP